MTTRDDLDHEAGARFIEKLLAEDPAKLCVATDEQVDAMMDRAGIEVAAPETTEELLARVDRRRRERQPRARTQAAPAPSAPAKKPAGRRAWIAAGVVAAAAGAAVVGAEIARPHRGIEEIRPEPPSPAPTPLEQAARLRTQALAACETQDFVACAAKLDDAKRLDPTGESDPRVVAARAAIATAAAPAPTREPSAPKPPAPDKPPTK